jgi:two-component system nitrate/nitrite response regulator NarL
MQMRVALVEDDAFTRLTLASSLRAQGLQVVIDTGSPSEALKEFSDARPHVALLDLHLGKGPTGIDLANAFRSQTPQIGIVFLTSFEEPRLLNPNLPPLPFRSVYLNKSKINDIWTILEALKAAVSKDEKLPSTPRGLESPIASLTDVQLETLRLMAQGLSNAEIAKRRTVTEKSVELAISRLAKTLGVEKDSTINQRVHMANVYFRALGQMKNVTE